MKQRKGFCVRRYYSKKEVHQIARDNGLELTYQHPEIREGWVGKPKGLLQVLWERGWVNEGELDMYSGDGEKIKKTKIIKSNQNLRSMF